jgi:hypothetical protein
MHHVVRVRLDVPSVLDSGGAVGLRSVGPRVLDIPT